jgi:hypothetical protein
LGVQGALEAGAMRADQCKFSPCRSGRPPRHRDKFFASAGGSTIWGSNLCDSNNGRWRVDAICGSLIVGEAHA